MLIVGMQPAHHALRVAADAFSNRRGRGALGDLVQGKEPLARAGVAGMKRQVPQIGWRLPPALIVNT